MDTTTILQIVAIIAGLALVLVRAIVFDSSGVSDFELQKRAKEGNPEARRERFFRERIPALLGLQYLAGALLTGVVIITAVYGFGLWRGTGLLLVGLVLVDVLSRWKPMVRLGQKIFQRYGAATVHFTLKVNWLFTFFRRSAHVSVIPSFYSREELLKILEKDRHVLSADEKDMIGRILEFSKKTISSVMTPYKKIEFVAAGDTVGPLLLDQLHKTGHPCFLVRDEGKNIVGTLWLEDVQLPLKPKIKQVKDAMRSDLRYVHQGWPLNMMWQASLHTKRHLFIVVDELENPVGLVTVYDALEQLVGRLHSTHKQYDDPKVVAEAKIEDKE